MPSIVKDKLNRAPVPKAHYRCDGVEFGAEVLSEIHFHEDDGGYRSSFDLYLDTLYEKETNTECTGYFCEQCIKAFKHSLNRKRTLETVIRDLTYRKVLQLVNLQWD